MSVMSWKKALCIAHCLISVLTLVLVGLVYRKVTAQGFGSGFGGGIKMMVDNADQFGEGFDAGGAVAAASAAPIVVQNDYVDVPNIGRVTLTGCQVSDVPQDDAWSWLVAHANDPAQENYAPKRAPRRNMKEGAAVDPRSGVVGRFQDANLTLDLAGLHSSQAPGARRVMPR